MERGRSPLSAVCQASLTIYQYPIILSGVDRVERGRFPAPPPPLSILSSFLDNSSVPNYTIGGRLGGRTSRVQPLAREHSSVTWPGLEPWALSKARYPEGPKVIQSRTNLCHSYPKTCPQLLCQSRSLPRREIDHRETFPRHLCCLAPEAD